MNRKRILSLFLAIAILLGCGSAADFSAYAAYEYTSGDYICTVLDISTAEITSYTGCASKITIPSTLSGYTITRIGNEAFQERDTLTSITIPNSITSIGDYAFSYCTKLTSMTIPNSVKSIGEHAFQYCWVLTSVTIGNSVASIGEYAFWNCDVLTNVTIPNSVTSIGYSAFYDCDKLTGINVNANNKNYASQDGVLFNKNKTMLIQYPKGNTRTSYTIPSSVTSIGISAFAVCDKLTSITIPNSVTSIRDSAFGGSALTSVTIPNSVVSIGECAFSNSDKLTSVSFGNSITSIGEDAFWDCDALINVTIPDSVASIGEDAFYDCDKLTGINVNANNKNYASQDGVLFNKNKTMLIQYPKGNTRTSYTVPDTITSIRDDTFYDCDVLTSVTIGNNVTSIGNYVFEDCDRLTSITIGSGVTKIGYGAFYDCDALTSVFYHGCPQCWGKIALDSYGNNALINARRTYIGYNAVSENPTCTQIGYIGYKCNNCGYTDITETIPAKGHNAVTDKAVAATCTTSGKTQGSHCSVCGTVLTAQRIIPATGHTYNAGIITQAPTGTQTGIKTYTCTACGQAYTELIPPTGVADNPIPVNPGTPASPAGNFEYRVLPDGTAEITKYTGTESAVVIPASLGGRAVTSIGAYAFEIQTEIISVTIPHGVTNIGDYAFYQCTALTSLSIPESVNQIGIGAFAYCPLKNIHYAGGYTKWQKVKLCKGNKEVTASTIQCKDASVVPNAPKGCVKINGAWVRKSQKNTKIKKLARAKKSFRASWSRVNGITGYQIQYSTSKKFTGKATKSVTIKKNRTTSATVKKLKSNKKYYVRIRTYKNVKQNRKTVRVYSSWSKAKSVKIK